MREGSLPPAVRPEYHPGKFLKNPAKSCILVTTALIRGSVGRVSELTASTSKAKSVQNFHFSAVVAPLVVRTKKSDGNYEKKINCCEFFLKSVMNC